MDKNSNSWVMIFAVGMCVVLAVLLAGTFEGLSSTVEANIVFDQKKNVLAATGLYDPNGEDKPSQEELLQLYDKYIREKVLEVERELVDVEVKVAGEVGTEQVEKVVGMTETEHKVADLAQLELLENRKPEAERTEFATFFTRIDDAGAPVAYCIPIEGLGLWGMIYGYLALEKNRTDVKGITFYAHKETPGLGGEIDKEWWQSQWPGKRLYSESGDFVSVAVKKGKVDPAVPFEAAHMVDGMSGATITGNGVTKFVEEDVLKYKPYLDTLQ